jgi:hypothetical protein
MKVLNDVQENPNPVVVAGMVGVIKKYCSCVVAAPCMLPPGENACAYFYIGV